MKRYLAVLLAGLMLLAAQAACAQNATYVFPYEGFRYTQKDNETVLTQTNLHEHEALIAQLGTTKEAILASYMASGIVMEVIPEGGGQIAVGVADAGEFGDVKDMAELDEARLAAFAAQFEESGLYESCALTETNPVCVRLTSSAMYASMPVYSLRYATLHLGRLYMITQTIVGRAPEAAAMYVIPKAIIMMAMEGRTSFTPFTKLFPRRLYEPNSILPMITVPTIKATAINTIANDLRASIAVAIITESNANENSATIIFALRISSVCSSAETMAKP